MSFLSHNVYISRVTETVPHLHIPDPDSPPNQREDPVWCWAYYEASSPCTVRLTSPTPDLTFGWEKDPTPTAQSIDLAFGPGNPLVRFWTVGQQSIGQPDDMVTISIEVL